MSNDASSGSTHDAQSSAAGAPAMGGGGMRSSHIHLARVQIEAARLRHERLIASGQLAAPFIDGSPPTMTLPGYTLLRELHRGGQGVVYLATQKSTDRQVAIKLLNRQMPTGAGPGGLARFEREIEILSRLNHPNIVTVHDCGRDHGHVFLVMDYVIGRPVDEWVRLDQTPLAQTLEVFAKICDGVNAAHLRGVIHRDLKPGNILVDESGEPHVLDFGLAKLVEDPADALFAQPMTITGQFVGSLPWASPEQAEGRPDALDIRTDVYSLGVILYQVLMGQFPYPVTGPQREVVRHIVDTSPARPSSVGRAVDRELETILLKCLAKEPERRYQSAGDLARDLRRYLAGDAIEARRDSLVYVMGKQLQRYRVAAGAAAAMLLVVLAALIVSIAFWKQAERQRTIAQSNATTAQQAAGIAEREAAQARAVNDFMREVLTSVEPENMGADVRLIQVLASASATASQRFQGHPQQEAQVRDLLGHVYNNLSLWNEARAEFSRSFELWRDDAGPDDSRTLASQAWHAGVLLNLEQTAAAERALDDLVPRLERVFGPDDPRTLSVRRDVAFVHLFRDRVDEAERLLLELRSHPAIANDDQMEIRILAGLIMVEKRRWATADSERLNEIMAGALALAQERVERSTRLHGAESADTLEAVAQVADFQCGLGQYQAAVDTCRRLMDSPYDRLGECHSVRMTAMHVLSNALTGLGQDAEAADLQLRRLECARAQFATASPPVFLGALFDTLRYLERGGRAIEGERLAREMTAALASIGGGHDDMALESELFLAHFVSMQNRLDEAEPMFTALLAREKDVLSDRVHARLHLYHAIHLVRCRRFEQAENEMNTSTQFVDVRVGTWDSHPDDIVLGFIMLYDAWNKPEQRQEYQRICDEMRSASAQR